RSQNKARHTLIHSRPLLRRLPPLAHDSSGAVAQFYFGADNLEVLSRLSTYAAVALYEICARYRDNPGGVTSRKPVGWWTDALSNIPGGDRREWRKFKSERIKEAVEEINRETDLQIELIEHRQGRTVDEVQFAVRRRSKVAPLVERTPAPIDANLALRAETLGIREIKLDALLKEFGEAQVREKLDALERRVANSSLRSVDNAYSYLRSSLRNEGGVAVPSAAAILEAPPSPKVAPAPSLAAPDVAGERIRAMRAEVEKLSPAERQIWVDRALQSLAAKGILTAVISRRAAQGDVLHGLLGSVVVHAYAAATYGPDWNVAAAFASSTAA
ncbi:MAG: RepB family plasmid replication initiator protein, partial [Comamonadaceae bacterium]